MITPAALALTAVLSLSGSARAFSAPAYYDAKAAPLDDLSREMLTGNGYEIREDGKVWDKIGESFVAQNDMAYLLSRLASAKRLRALLEINNIITRYDAERNLTPEDKEAVRVLVRQNWIVFGIVPRNDFRAYFSVQEREALDKIPPRFEAMSAMNMIDPSPESITGGDEPEPVKKSPAPAVTAVPPAAVPVAVAPAVAANVPSVTALPPAAPAAVAPPAVAAVVPPAAAPVVAPVATPVAPVVTEAIPMAAPVPAAPVAVPIPAPVAAPAVVAAPPPAPPQAVAAVAPVAAAPAVAVLPAKVIPTLTPIFDLPSLKRPSPFAHPAPVAVPPAIVAAPPVVAAPAVVAAPPVVAAPAVVAPPAIVAAPAAVAAPAVAMAPAAVPVPIAVVAPPAAVIRTTPAGALAYKAEPAAPPPAIVLVAPPVVPSTAAVVSGDLGTLKAWVPPGTSTAAPVAALKPLVVAVATVTAPVVAAAPPPPPGPKFTIVDEPEYDKFVAEGPYSKEGKAMLELIGKRAPDYCLPLLRRAVVDAVPQIVSDGARTGAELRAGFTRDAADPLAPPVVALSPGPVFVTAKKGMFGSRETVLLPESPKIWSELGVARPALDAMRDNATPVSTENGEWGAIRLYADGSRRGSFSATEQAGELLEQLLLLGLAREGLDASPYAARRWARTARLMFYARMKEETQQDNFLDPDRRAELRDWLDRPAEADDLVAAVWSGSRRQILDPRRGPPEAERDFDSRARAACVRSNLENLLVEGARRRASRVGELETLLDAGVIDGSSAKAAAQSAADAEEGDRRRLLAAPPSCPVVDSSRAEGLRKAALVMAESARAEHQLRERKAGIESHAL